MRSSYEKTWGEQHNAFVLFRVQIQKTENKRNKRKQKSIDLQHFPIIAFFLRRRRVGRQKKENPGL